MIPFLGQLESVRTKALDHIRKILNERGTNYELTDPSNYEDGLEDEVLKLPRGNCLNNRMYYFEFPIVVVDIKDNVLSFQGVDLGDYYEDKVFTEEEMETSTLCHIADVISNLEFQSIHG